MDPIQSGDRAREKIAAKSDVDKIADAVLYEGYILYPYRPTAVKNQQRFNFGVLAPVLATAACPGPRFRGCGSNAWFAPRAADVA